MIPITTGNTVITMTSLEMVDFINCQRAAGEAELRHDHFMAKVPKVLGIEAPKFLGTQKYGNNISRAIYIFPKREACLMAMSYSYDLQAKVFDRMTELEEKVPAVDPLSILNDPASMRGLLLNYTEKVIALEQKVAVDAPKVAFVEKYVDSTGCKGFRQVCKLLGANESNFREFLLDEKIMYRLGGEWVPFAEHLSADRFVVKTGTAEATNHAFNQALFTPKGVTWIAGEWAKYQLLDHSE